MGERKKPTMQELEAILDEDDLLTTIDPDGSVHTVNMRKVTEAVKAAEDSGALGRALAHFMLAQENEPLDIHDEEKMDRFRGLVADARAVQLIIDAVNEAERVSADDN